MKAFDNIYVMTKGGPGTASMVMAMYGYQVSFSQSNMGYGSCISVAIFVLSLLVIGGSQGLIKYLTRDPDHLFTLLHFPDRVDGIFLSERETCI